jgi:hypothetical protein
MRKKTLTLKLKPLQSSCWKIKEFLVLIWLSNLTVSKFLSYNTTNINMTSSFFSSKI